MKAKEIMDEVYSLALERKNTDGCDQLVTGDCEKEVKKVAITCIATPDVIDAAYKFGADLLITHEPTLASHRDVHDMNDKLVAAKLKYIEDRNLTVYRFHDNIHAMPQDFINVGELSFLGWKGTFDGGTDFVLDEPVTLLELAKNIEEKLDIKHVKIVGNKDQKIRNIALCSGARGIDSVNRVEKYDVIIAGELVEWRDSEYVRDAAQLGWAKSMIVIGHITSERHGMEYFSSLFARLHPELEVKYFDSGDVYWYTDSVKE